jgi:guanylate kinase
MEKKDFIVWASKLQESYKPSQEVIDRLAKIELVAIIGPTGVGKSTIIDSIDLPVVLSDVTREKRPGENDGKNYNFAKDYLRIIDDIKQGRYVQFLISNSGEFYGTKIDSYPQSGRCTMAVYANAIAHFRSIGFQKITAFYIMPPSYVEWMRRIGGVRTKDLLSRISEARDSILIALEDDSYNFILNDTIEFAMRDISLVLSGQKVSDHRTMLARGTADILLEKIGEPDL